METLARLRSIIKGGVKEFTPRLDPAPRIIYLYG